MCGCSGTNEANDAGTTGDDAGGSEAASCAAGSHRGGDGTCTTSIRWTPGPKLATARNHHMTFVTKGSSGSSLWVAGGFGKSGLLSSVERAPIGEDGMLGPWTPAAALPEKRAGAGVAVVRNLVVVAGGLGAKTTYTARVQDDGSLGPWSVGPELPAERFHTAAIANDDVVFLVGGLEGIDTVTEVRSARVGADGALSAWNLVGTLPRSLSHHQLAVAAGKLWVISGESGNPNDGSAIPHPDVYASAIAADGSLGPFVSVGALPRAVVTGAALTAFGTVWTIGGLSCGATEGSCHSTAEVLRATVKSDGSLDAFRVDATSALPIARSHVHQTPVEGTHVYSTGGAVKDPMDALDAVYVGAFE